jgi:hypothetical protein
MDTLQFRTQRFIGVAWCVVLLVIDPEMPFAEFFIPPRREEHSLLTRGTLVLAAQVTSVRNGPFHSVNISCLLTPIFECHGHDFAFFCGSHLISGGSDPP